MHVYKKAESMVDTTFSKSLVIAHHKEELRVEQVKTPRPSEGQVLVKVSACGVCHTDVHAVDGDWDLPTILPLTPGHEGVGTVVAVGHGVDHLEIGDRVGIAWLHSSCGACEYCTTGRETHCSDQENSGYTVQGCFAEYTLADANFVVKIPDDLNDFEAAPILCAGVTTYTGIKNTGVRAGQFLTIIGAAGGLGHLAVQYATAMGIRVLGIDVGQEKLEFIQKLGADFAVDGSSPDAVEQVQKLTGGGSHGVLCLAASMGAIQSAVRLVRRNGTVVLVGLPPGQLPIDVSDMVMRGLTLKGSLVGTRDDLREALDFAARRKVRSEIEVCDASDINTIFTKLRKGQVKGRIVIDLQKLE